MPKDHAERPSGPPPGRAPRARLLLALGLGVAAVVLAGCAATTALNHGRQAEQRQDYDRAVAEYSKALRLDPDNANARLALQRAKLRASEYHLNRGKRYTTRASSSRPPVVYQIASELNPGSSEVDAALRETRNQLRARVAVTAEGSKTRLETLIERT
ncbi:MAG: tetratricopeptide repeat protein, partial [Acidobacteria bacterium]